LLETFITKQNNAMKKLSAIAIVLLISFSACKKHEDVAPAASTAQDPDAPQAARFHAKDSTLQTPITGVIDGVPFSGIFRITKFIEKGGQIYAVGHLTDLTGIAGHKRKPIEKVLEHKPLHIPVSFAPQVTAGPLLPATCDILNLVLGPLHLNVLGLVVDLNQVVLTITGATGAGNLLGNLLCAITGLLDPLGSLTQIVALLNQLITLIGTL
jgi:hypothetical protein